MRIRRLLLALFALAGSAAAQFTTVTGTVVDPNGIPYAYGTVSATLVSAGGQPATLNGAGYTPPTQPTGLDKSGTFALRVGDNTVLRPINTKWNFTVCSAIGTVQPAIGTGSQCFSLAAPITISGASQDISAQLNAVALALSLGTGGGGGGGSTLAGSKFLYVDGNRTDVYVAKGTVLLPFKTIGAAVAAIVAAADNSTHPYIIRINPATYAETVDFGNAALFDVTLWADSDPGSSGAATVKISPGAGNAIQAIGNDDQLNLTVSGVYIDEPVDIVDPGAGNLGFTAINCYFSGSANVTLNNTISTIRGGLLFSGSISVTAGSLQLLRGADLRGNSTTLATGALLQLESGSSFSGSGTLTVASGTTFNMLSAEVDSSMTTTIQSGGTLFARSSAIAGTFNVNAGATFTCQGCWYNLSTATILGTLNAVPASPIGAACANGLTWTPATGYGCLTFKPSPAILLTSTTTLGAPVTINNVAPGTTVISHAVTMPASGCPCAAQVSYSLYLTAAAVGADAALVSDGTNFFATAQTATAGAVSNYGLNGGGVSTGTYANNATVTFSLIAASTHAGSTTANTGVAPNLTGAQSSFLNITILTSQ